MPESKKKEDREALIDTYFKKKMNRLEKFYKYGLSEAGWNKYAYINLEFDNQIICKKRKKIN
jgi:cell division protein FtsQ